MKVTRLLMVSSAIVLVLPAVAAMFLAEEVLRQIGAQPSELLVLLIQLLGALYLGFAGLNYTARDSIIGGIYARPVVLGNLLHYVAGALILVRTLSRAPQLQVLWVFTLFYILFAIAFAVLLFRHPRQAAD